jgi:hypothetical protein
MTLSDWEDPGEERRAIWNEGPDSLKPKLRLMRSSFRRGVLVFGYLIGQALLSLLPFLRLAFKKSWFNDRLILTHDRATLPRLRL